MDLQGRTDPPFVADEATQLAAFLDFQRQTLALKCAGLTGEQLRVRSVEPSGLSLLGLVRHLTENERGWIQNVLGRAGDGDVYCTPDNQEADFNDLDDADPAANLETWRAECERSRRTLAALAPDATGDHNGKPVTVRWVLIHMIEEYARHNGHADLLRERIDGTTGE